MTSRICQRHNRPMLYSLDLDGPICPTCEDPETMLAEATAELARQAKRQRERERFATLRAEGWT